MEGSYDESDQKSNVVLKVDSLVSWNSFLSEATTKGVPIVAHFTASWCMPSVAMESFFEDLALTYQDAVFLTVDVDEVKEVASKYEVKAMPTFLLIKEGAQVDKLVGANPEEVKKRVDNSLVQTTQVSVV